MDLIMRFNIDGCQILPEDKHTERPSFPHQENFIPFADLETGNNLHLEKRLNNSFSPLRKQLNISPQSQPHNFPDALFPKKDKATHKIETVPIKR